MGTQLHMRDREAQLNPTTNSRKNKIAPRFSEIYLHLPLCLDKTVLTCGCQGGVCWVRQY